MARMSTSPWTRPLAATVLAVLILASECTARAPAGFRLAALDSGTVAVSWPAVRGGGRVRIWRAGAPRDDILVRGAGTYLDRGLWPRSRYRYAVQVLTRHGRRLAAWSASVVTGARSGSFPRPFAADGPFNAPLVPGSGLEAGSAGIVSASIVPYVRSANLSNGADWGIPVFYADRHSRRYEISCDRYCSAHIGPRLAPAGARASTGSDHHLVVMDPSGVELDLWDARPAQRGGWVAGVRSVVPLRGSGIYCRTCGRPDVAGFALTAGIVRPEEIAQGHIDHALVITTPYTRRGVTACPAQGTDGEHADLAAVPIGARLRLDPGLDVKGLALAPWKAVIARALQQYGAYVVDTGGSLSIRAESNLGRGYNAWGRAHVPISPDLSDLPWQRLQVLPIARC